MTLRASLLVALGLAVVSTACGPELVEVPEPSLTGLSEQAREQLVTERQSMNQVVASPEASDDELALAYGDMGRHYHAYELFSAAEPAYKNARALQPGRFDWHYLLGHMYRQAERYEAAVDAFRQALEIAPEHVPALRWLAEMLLVMGDTDGAEEAANRALAVNPESAPVLVTMAKITAEREEHRRTIELLERARELSPEATEMNYPLGLAYRALGDTETAQRYLDQRGRVVAAFHDPIFDAVQDLVISAGAALNKGTRALSQGKFDEAEEAFRTAIELHPDNVKGYTNLGYVLAAKGEGVEAYRVLKYAVELDPEDAKANFNLATLLVKAGEYDAAMPHFEQAVESDPTYTNAHYNYANNLMRVGRLEDAAEHYGQVFELDPSNETAALMYGVVMGRLEQWDASVATLTTAEQAFPESPTIKNALARVLATAPDLTDDDRQRAVELAQGLFAKDSDASNAEALAMALAGAGRYAEAVEQQEAILAAVRSAERRDMLPILEENLARYRNGEPANRPWAPGDPSLPGIR